VCNVDTIIYIPLSSYKTMIKPIIDSIFNRFTFHLVHIKHTDSMHMFGRVVKIYIPLSSYKTMISQHRYLAWG